MIQQEYREVVERRVFTGLFSTETWQSLVLTLVMLFYKLVYCIFFLWGFV